MPAVKVRRVFLGAPRDPGLPVHRLQIHRKSGPLQQLPGDRRQVREHVEIRRMEHDGSSIILCFVQQRGDGRTA